MEKNRKWSKQTLEILIDQYEHFECLYNTKSSHYFNREKPRDAYDAILTVIQEHRPRTTVEELKYKIRTLRIQFVQEYKKIQCSYKSGAGTGDVYTPKVWWFERMLFLRNYVDARKGKANIVIPQIEEQIEEVPDEDTYEVDYLEDTEDNLFSPCSTSSLLEDMPSCSSVEERPVSRVSERSSVSNNSELPASKKSKRKISTISEPKPTPSKATRIGKLSLPEVAAEALNKISSKIDQSKTENKEHEFSTFGKYVGETLASIRDKFLAQKLKHEILKILIEGENKQYE